MRITKTILALAIVGGLSACVDNDAERGLIGAAGGAVLADATGNSAVTGALIGGAAGVFCDDAGVCR